MEQRYVRVTNGLADKGELIPATELDSSFTSDKDHYCSVNYYNQEHFEQFQKKGSIAGITDVKTDKIVFDFDSKENLELARKDALEVVKRLEKMKIDIVKDTSVYFSGQKGFTVLFKVKNLITPEQHANIALDVIGKDLKTLDPSMYNASRVLRMPNTKHNSSGFYKVQISAKQLKNCSLDQIKELAERPTTFVRPDPRPVELPNAFFETKKVEETKFKSVALQTDMSQKPKHWKDYKWALLNAEQLKAGERTTAMMVIASTCRALGYTRNISQGFLESFDENYSEVTKQERDASKIDGCLDSVFSENWQGGQYSIKNNAWLKQYCERLGIKDSEFDDGFVSISEMANTFNDYATKFDSKIVATGIEELDQKMLMLTSTHNGILGQPGSGKTSFSLQWLRNAANEDNAALFYSLDMAQPLVYGKLVQQEWGNEKGGLSFKEAMRKYATDDIARKMVDAAIQSRYKNVSFNYRTGTTPEMMKDDVKRFEDKIGKKVRLVITDYLECIQGPYSDQTANTGYISNQMKDFANELDVCSAILLQTQKHSTSDISDPLNSMKQIKGSSVIEQSSSVVLTLWREGYNPDTQDQDKYMSFAVVKNRFGGLSKTDLSWNGRIGVISSLSDEGAEDLKKLREQKKARKAEEAGKDPWK